MRIEFEINDLLNKDQNYIVSYLEGNLKIFVKGILFFDQTGIPLIEFALFIKKWLEKVKLGNAVDFVYETMDHEQPILLLSKTNDEFYKIDSIWKEAEVYFILSKEEIIFGFEEYLDVLKISLIQTVGIRLEDVLQD